MARSDPDQLASTEFTPAERKAIALIAWDHINEPAASGGRRQTKEVPPDEKTMTIGQAVLWIARLGGYTSKSSGGPPGTVVISRGIDYIAGAAAVLEAASSRRKRK